MPDPNRARDRALEDIAKSLRSIDVNLKDIAKSVRIRSGRMTFRNYIEGEESDGATTPAGSAEFGESQPSS